MSVRTNRERQRTMLGDENTARTSPSACSSTDYWCWRSKTSERETDCHCSNDTASVSSRSLILADHWLLWSLASMVVRDLRRSIRWKCHRFSNTKSFNKWIWNTTEMKNRRDMLMTVAFEQGQFFSFCLLKWGWERQREYKRNWRLSIPEEGH